MFSKSRSRKKPAFRCNKFNTYSFLSCREKSTLILFCLCRLTGTFASRSRPLNEHEHICHAYVYRHAMFECHSLNIVWDIASIAQVTNLSSLRRIYDLEWRTRSSDLENVIYTFSRTILIHSKVDGHCLKSFWNSETFIIFTIKSCVTLNEWRPRSI